MPVVPQPFNGPAPFDYRLAGANLKRRHDDRQARRQRLFDQARTDCRRIVAMMIERF